MKIRMLTRIEGTRNAQRWPEAGGELDLPDGEARDLIAGGLAEPVGDQPETATPPAPEKATPAAPEKATPAEPVKRKRAAKKS